MAAGYKKKADRAAMAYHGLTEAAVESERARGQLDRILEWVEDVYAEARKTLSEIFASLLAANSKRRLGPARGYGGHLPANLARTNSGNMAWPATPLPSTSSNTASSTHG